MKKTLFPLITLISLLFITATVSAQIRKIPSSATDNFKTKYPDAENVEWKDKISHYSALFTINDKSYEAHFDNDGNWKESIVKLDDSEVPAEVNDGYSKSKYTDWSIDKVEKIETNTGKIQYRMQVKKGDLRKKILYFTPEGRLSKDHITLWF
ncbi:MAG TPA: PepSY-like domain-containing protein [Chitinophagaceae bacterium]|nr:PepSY-like domain-containing protein [Chitinophagaceae bacterium]